jgi:hypothetical protein
MPVDAVPVAPPDSGPLYRLIRRTRLLLRATWLVTGLALTIGLFLGALGLVVAADLMLPMLQLPYWIAYNIDTGLRLASLVLVVAPPAVAFAAGVLYPLVRRLSAGQVARRIEKHLPGIHNRLVSCIDLEARGRAAASPVFYRRLLTESLDRIRGFRPRRVLDFLRTRRAGLIAAVGTAGFVVVWLCFSNQMPTALARIFQPFDDIPPVGLAAFSVQPGSGDFLREEKIDFSAAISRGTPGSLKLQLQAANGATTEQSLEPAPDDPASLRRELDTVSIGQAYQKGFHYRVYGAGTWSPRYAVNLVERPLITGVDTAVFYPAYMGIPDSHPTPREASEVVGPEGGEIEVVVQAEGQVAEGDIQLLKPGKLTLAPREQVERVWFEDAPPATAPDAGKGGAWDRAVKEKRPAHTEPAADGTHGHWFQDDPTGFPVQAGDSLFAYVWIDPRARPDEILLEWNDGKSWEHRAYWGVDLIKEGKSGTPSRLPIQKLPDGGGWVRLEVPAKDVDLEGKTLRGMAFKLSGGQCWWAKSGAVRVEEPTFLVDKAFPMHADESGHWVGRLPLTGKGVFRAELRNRQKYANKTMTELRYGAVKDQPPQVVLQRPGVELTLGQAQAPPLTVAAFDDYGLADLKLLFRENEAQPFQTRVLRHYEQPERSSTLVSPLQEAAELKMGGILHYYLEVSDRKGQTGRTPESVVRIAADPNAADMQEAAFDKTQDTFRDRLLQLIAEQKKVQTNVEKLTAQYAQMTDKVRKDQEAAQPQAPSTDPTKPPQPKDGPKIDPETAKQLAELQKQLAQLALQETQNAQNASQLNNDLANANAQADKLQTLPQPLLDQMQTLQQAFEQTAVKGMQNLTQQFNQGANAQAGAPDLKDINQKSDRLAKDLEGLKDRMEALNEARKGLRDDLAKALQDLQREMLNQNGQLSERDLQELRDFIARMREQLKDLQNQQENLLNNAENGGDLKDVEQKQADLDKQLEKMLEAARKMLDAKRNPNRRKPNFPDSPYTPDSDEAKVPPRDDDGNDPLPNQKKPGDKDNHPGDKKPDQAKDDDDKEPLDMPALGGPKQVPDKRFDKKKRPVDKKPDDKDDPDSQRNDLEDHQSDRLRDLDAAQKSLASDQQSLEQMLQNLEQAMKANKSQKRQKGQQGQPNEADDGMQQLQQMLQSSAMQQALAMARRMAQAQQAARGQQPHPPGNQPPPPSQNQSSLNGNNPPVSAADLSKLPLDTREAILKLPPRVREELLQGLREQGPEGYGPFIEDYFKRLTESKNP